MDDHRKEVLRAYQDASAELRREHDGEFHSILERLYEERGITVKKRRSRKQVQQDRIREALEIVANINSD